MTPDIGIEITLARLGHCKYEALSSVWGGQAPSIEVGVAGRDFWSIQITKSLDTALRCLCGLHDRILWIDALCINQADLKERSKQVKRMDHIFRKAETVIIWLGEPAGQSDLAFEFIKKIRVQELDGLAHGPPLW
jgi:hypothetical protein